MTREEAQSKLPEALRRAEVLEEAYHLTNHWIDCPDGTHGLWDAAVLARKQFDQLLDAARPTE